MSQGTDGYSVDAITEVGTFETVVPYGEKFHTVKGAIHKNKKGWHVRATIDGRKINRDLDPLTMSIVREGGKPASDLSRQEEILRMGILAYKDNLFDAKIIDNKTHSVHNVLGAHAHLLRPLTIYAVGAEPPNHKKTPQELRGEVATAIVDGKKTTILADGFGHILNPDGTRKKKPTVREQILEKAVEASHPQAVVQRHLKPWGF